MSDLRCPLAVLSKRLAGVDLAGACDGEFGGDFSPAGRPRIPIRLMIGLLYSRNSFNLSDAELVERWAEGVQWQFFSGIDDYDPRLPCHATQIGRFLRLLGEDGIEQLLKSNIDCAVDIKAVKQADLQRVIVDLTVQAKAIAHPVGSRLLKIARHKVVRAATRAGIACKQPYVQEGKTLKRWRTSFGVVMREVQRKRAADKTAVATGGALAHEASSPKALGDLETLLQRAKRMRTEQRSTKNKRYAPGAECISKGKARNPYEFGVKVSLLATHKQGLMVGARSFPGNTYDGHVLSAQLEQTANLLQDTGRAPKQVLVDLGYRGVDADNPSVRIIYRGRYKALSDHEKRLLKRRQAIEPLIGHTKADHRIDRCWLQGAVGDALHALGVRRATTSDGCCGQSPDSVWAGFFAPCRPWSCMGAAC